MKKNLALVKAILLLLLLSCINAVLSIRRLAEGEISSNKKISPIVEMTRNENCH